MVTSLPSLSTPFPVFQLEYFPPTLDPCISPYSIEFRNITKIQSPSLHMNTVNTMGYIYNLQSTTHPWQRHNTHKHKLYVAMTLNLASSVALTGVTEQWNGTMEVTSTFTNSYTHIWQLQSVLICML